MLIFVLALFATGATRDAPASATDVELTRLLDRTVWIDIGLGRRLKEMTRGQIAELRKCREPSMALQKTDGAWVQSFYAGIELRTVYSSAVLRKNTAGDTILFYSAGQGAPAETLHVARGSDVLVEQTRGFRPHTFLKCTPPGVPSKKK